MKLTLKAGLAVAALGLTAGMAGSATAADLNGRGHGGSIKDGGFAHAPAPMAAAGPCYFRADAGYSWSRDPKVKWPVVNGIWTDNGSGDGVVTADELSTTYIGDQVTNTQMDNTWFGGAGFGCGSGSRGLRGEVMFNIHGDRKLDGEPRTYNPGPQVGDPDGTTPPDVVDPLHTSIKTYTLMFNVYHDLGKFGNVTPYVGAGVGLAYNMMSDVYFTDNPALTNRIHGDRDISLAWSLMAGIGYQVAHNTILDVGYRYLDMGKATSERHDSAGFVNPRVRVEDITAHEFKVGLRYHFGSDCCSAPAYAPMK